MATDDLYIEQDDEGNAFVRLSPEDAKAQRELARQATKNKDAADQLALAQRELAFYKAGIDTESALGKMFVKAYDGELTADAIKTAAAEIPGFVNPVEPQPEQQEQVTEPTAEELAEQRLRQQLATGQAPGQGPSPDPRAEMKELISKARTDGMADDKALALGFGVLREAANRGDDRVIIDVWGSKNTA